MPPAESERIGELLFEEGIVTQEELARGIAEGGLKGSALAQLIDAIPHVRRADLTAFLATHYRVPTIEDLRRFEFASGAAKLVPEEIARKHELIPLARLGDVLCVAKANYFNRAAVQELRRITGLKIKVMQADEGQVRAAVELVYRGRKGDLPLPGAARKKDTSVPTPAPAPVRPAPVLSQAGGGDDVPLISMPDERPAPAHVQAAAPVATVPRNGASVDEVIEIMDAVRIPSQEFTSALRDPFARLVIEFDDLFQHGKPAQPQRVS